MSNTQHTPGPWNAKMRDPQEWAIDTGPDRRLGYGSWSSMARVYGSDASPSAGAEVAKANALLIAAAPDLLDALQGILADEGPDYIRSRLWEKARAAVEKATGTET